MIPQAQGSIEVTEIKVPGAWYTQEGLKRICVARAATVGGNRCSSEYPAAQVNLGVSVKMTRILLECKLGFGERSGEWCLVSLDNKQLAALDLNNDSPPQKPSPRDSG